MESELSWPTQQTHFQQMLSSSPRHVVIDPISGEHCYDFFVALLYCCRSMYPILILLWSKCYLTHLAQFFAFQKKGEARMKSLGGRNLYHHIFCDHSKWWNVSNDEWMLTVELSYFISFYLLAKRSLGKWKSFTSSYNFIKVSYHKCTWCEYTEYFCYLEHAFLLIGLGEFMYKSHRDTLSTMWLGVAM